jgi:hypothetical protein
MQQPADERALPVIHAATGQKAQQLLLLVPIQVSVNIFALRVSL